MNGKAAAGLALLLTVLLTPLPRGGGAVWAQRPPSPRLIVRLLNGPDEARRVQAISAIHRNPAAWIPVVDQLVHAARLRLEKTSTAAEIPSSTFRLVRSLARIEHRDVDAFLTELLDCDRTEIAMSVADALGEFQRGELISALRQQTELPEFESHYGFRFNLVRALVRMKHPQAIEFLGELEPTLDGQLAYETGKQLDAVTADDFRGDEARFQAWKEKTGRARQSEPIQLVASSGSRQPIRLAESDYYGIPIHAKSVAFVLDCSGSMNDRTYHSTRLAEAKRELVRTIRSLPADAEFTIIIFNEMIHPWRHELTTASEENKASAFQFIRRVGCGKATNTYGALRRAIDLDDNLEAIYLLSDGRPNRGSITAPGMIVSDIATRNRFRHLVINTIGVAVRGVTESFMRALAEQNAGEFRAVD